MRNRAMCALVVMLFGCSVLASATCEGPFYFEAKLDTVTSSGAVSWLVSTWPYRDCSAPGASCGTVLCSPGPEQEQRTYPAAAACAAASTGLCYNIELATCSDNPGVNLIKSWAIIDPSFCATE